jgi:hypothetical protein
MALRRGSAGISMPEKRTYPISIPAQLSLYLEKRYNFTEFREISLLPIIPYPMTRIKITASWPSLI